MNKLSKYIIIAILTTAVGAVLALKQNKTQNPLPQIEQTNPSVPLPRLVDLGADKCIPCKMMAPILEELKTEYQGKLQVVFIDVGKNPDAGQKYGIRVIPTQIFYDASGKELFRHEGFFAKEDILGKWKEFGIELKKTK
jgi:thioredoxin 1